MHLYGSDPMDDFANSDDMSDAEDMSDGSKDTPDDFEDMLGSEDHPVLFELAEETLEGSFQPVDLGGHDSDLVDDSVEDAAEIEDSALSEALKESI